MRLVSGTVWAAAAALRAKGKRFRFCVSSNLVLGWPYSPTSSHIPAFAVGSVLGSCGRPRGCTWATMVAAMEHDCIEIFDVQVRQSSYRWCSRYTVTDLSPLGCSVGAAHPHARVRGSQHWCPCGPCSTTTDTVPATIPESCVSSVLCILPRQLAAPQGAPGPR